MFFRLGCSERMEGTVCIMKRILIIHYSMELGGAESSLLGLLQSFDYTRYKVDLLLLNPIGELLELLPKEVNLIETPKKYRALVVPLKETIKQKEFGICIARICGRFAGNRYKSKTYMIKQYTHKIAMRFLPSIKDSYDLAISFIDPHYIIGKKVNAKVKMAWMHTDFSRVNINVSQDRKMWNQIEYVVNVSDSCKECFDKIHPELERKSIVVENILSANLLLKQADAFSVDEEMENDGSIKLLSVGRFSYQKNFDNIPDICKKILKMGLKVKWYIVGYGTDEELIKKKIKEVNVENNVIILGKKANPYPYMKACDIYVQPSRYEGKCVAVREAQILEKPIVITDYVTSSGQLTNGLDGIVVPLDNEQCAVQIAKLIKNKELQKELIKNIKKQNYTNSGEIEKIYSLME